MNEVNNATLPILPRSQQAVYKGCTRDAHRVYQLKSHGLPVGIPCTPLAHGLGAG
ncbi:MAG: hypothetical protein QM840_06735 [Verrucomicrobiota bacterium]|nr:hypothetical protein [Verrucomicrobiota bacterium]